MKALCIRQPWAQAIVEGFKPVENRDWFCAYRGLLLIHAGLKWDRDGEAFIRKMLPAKAAEALIARARTRCGGFVGRAVLTDCTKRHPSPWFFGDYGWVLADPEAFPAVVPYKGALGLMHVPEDVRAKLPPLQKARGAA